MARHIITGGLGFLGSHLAVKLLKAGHDVLIFDLGINDDGYGGAWLLNKLFEQHFPGFLDGKRPVSVSLLQGDARDRRSLGEAVRMLGGVDVIWSMACTASPPRYKAIPTQVLEASSLGIHAAVTVAKVYGAKVILTSTSEVYGDPLVSPQPETYRGNVDPTGPRSMYDEGKRYAEAYLTAALPPEQRQIARIFNAVGPIRPDDGRMIPQMVFDAIHHGVINVHGDGTQGRSVVDVGDLITGLLLLQEHGDGTPTNLGGTEEWTVYGYAWTVRDVIRELTGRKPAIKYIEQPCAHDPLQRCADITKAGRLLNWRPETSPGLAVDAAVRWIAKALLDG